MLFGMIVDIAGAAGTAPSGISTGAIDHE